LIILIGVKAPGRAYLTALLALLGSLGGNLLLFYLARRGGRRFAEQASGTVVTGKRRRFRAWFDRYGLATVFIPAIVPIPLPLKVFVISAGVLRTPVSHFIAVIVAARFIRYFGEAYLAIRLGEDAQTFLTRNAWSMVGIALLLFALLYAVIRVNDRRRSAAGLG
jgi:membrane protein YqaA with SNARE-associated domain